MISWETDSLDSDIPSSLAITVVRDRGHGGFTTHSREHGISTTRGRGCGSSTTSARGYGASRDGASASETDNPFPMVTETWEQDEEPQPIAATSNKNCNLASHLWEF